MHTLPRERTQSQGFTLIELIVVMAIVALLAGIAAPRYFAKVDAARGHALRSSLNVMRSAIDHFAADKARYPNSLQELVEARYLRQIPEDPLSGSRSTWQLLTPPAELEMPGQVFDVKSGTPGRAPDGSLYADW
ncbi:type II secretion system protein [Paucibacter sp. Y2R2-4]|uniref:type II secretion system protein n=1 Tax=Paucibacter sp. Y2R2-4 TaxID=2893553 RepID=UPI0021E3958C|nr:type II secretion system GspH family protein [Paucibacter sp. Y2R2-4]MCV2349673.1 type II secretion system GspH family protein [Paucibacter sp. Y2R2-4]